MIDKHIVKWGIITLLLKTSPLIIIGLIVYSMSLMQKGLLFYIFLPLTIFLLVVLYFVLLSVFAGLIARAYAPIKEGVFNFHSKEVDSWRAQMVVLETVNWFQKIFDLPAHIFVPYFRFFFKSKIALKSMVIGEIHDPGLFELGDNSIIGRNSTILSHFIEKEKLILKKVKIGKNCTIGANSIISPGVIIGDNTIVGACSFVPKNKKLDPNSVYVGIPAKKLKSIKK